MKSLNRLFFLLPFLFAVPFYSEAQQSEFKIGIITSLTGPAAGFGQGLRNGFFLGLEDSKNTSIKIILEDHQFQPLKAVTSFNKLITQDKVDLVFMNGAGPAMAVAPLAQEKRILLIALAGDHQVSKGRSYVIRVYPSGRLEGALVAKEAQRLGYDRIGIITTENDFTVANRIGFLENISPSKIVFDERMLPDERDFKSVLAKAKQKGVKQLYLCAILGQQGLLAKVARELKVADVLFGVSSSEDPREIVASAGALKGSWYYNMIVDPAFSKRYKERFGDSDYLPNAAIAHDVALLLSEVLPKTRNDSETIPALLKTGPHSGALKSFEIITKDDENYIEMPMEKKVVQ